MLELILSILLGLLLLFVLLLLVTELVATYPVWKQFGQLYSTQNTALSTPHKGSIGKQKILLLSVAAASAVCLLAFLLAQQTTEKKKPLPVNAKKLRGAVPAKQLAASSADSTVFFRLQMKWADGKLYGNSTVIPAADAVQQLNDCRFYLLDQDGFLIKVISFLPNDFLFSTEQGGKARYLLNKFNTELSIGDYVKIEKLQVALNGKISAEIKP